MSGVTVARVYSNGATKEAFGYIWEGFFNAVKTATGKGIKFTAVFISIGLNSDNTHIARLGGAGI